MASRILPIRIHELDPHDTRTFENETGTPLRCIDFIFKAPGINRPLTVKKIDEAIRWMEIAAREPPFFHAKNYPYLSDAFRHDARFQEIVEKMNYPA